jgi:hypothetical protein
VSDTRSPDPSLGPSQRRQTTIDNLTRIGQALEAYRSANGAYPGSAMLTTTGQPMLSWRVALLPYLGYQALYDQFHLDEPWSSPHNRSLLAQIPAVYQSPERFDTNTNYLVPTGAHASFSNAKANHPRRWEDGLDNIVLLLEVDDAAAVPWTQPRDWDFDARNPGRLLGSLRQDGFFAVFGGGTLSRVPAETSTNDLKAMFTVDGGESFSAGTVCRAALADPAPAAASNAAAGPIADATQRPPASAANTAIAAVNRPQVTANSGSETKLAQLARQAYAAGLESDGARLAMAAFLLDESTATVQYQWIPALRRPVTVLRFGVGLDYTGADAASVRRQLANPNEQSGAPPSRLASEVGDLAQPIFDRLQAARPLLPPVADPDRTPASAAKTAVPLQVLGMADVRTMVRAALLNDVDVVFMFDVDEKTTRSGAKSKSAGFSVWDVWNNREIFKLPAVNYLRRKHAQDDPLYRDPVEMAAERFAEFLETELRGEPLPSALRPEIALRRVESLSKLRRDNPLPLLSEMKFYRDAGLISVEQLLTGYTGLLGTTPGTELLAGSATEKQQAIAGWIPDLQLQLADRPRGTPTLKDRDD